jgi:site-specific DNA-methyltransferase (adenine-specific)
MTKARRPGSSRYVDQRNESRVYFRGGGVTLYHGDAREILPTLPRVAHVITDPPYDAKTHAGATHAVRPDQAPIDFAPLDAPAIVPLLLDVSERWTIAFCALEMLGSYQLAAGDAWVRAGFWRRTDGAPQFTGDRPGQPGEAIAIMHTPGARKRWHGGGSSAFWEYGVERVARTHPTQKPERLIAALVSLFTDPGDVILDPFSGSGTTLVACKRLGRLAIGIEQDVDHCKRTVERLRQGALDLFGGDDTTGDLLNT